MSPTCETVNVAASSTDSSPSYYKCPEIAPSVMPPTAPPSTACILSATRPAAMDDATNRRKVDISSEFRLQARRALQKSTRRMNEAPDPSLSNKRSRTSKPKVKTGCITCKIRRVKCDEQKPNCNRCTSTGRKCDGYSVVRSPEEQQQAGDESTGQSNALIVRQNEPIWAIEGTNEERRSFEFFRSRTAIELSGFFESGFWNRVVLQAAHYEPAVRHAVLALSSLHERFEVGDKSILSPVWDRTEGGFALQHYNQAIQEILKPTHGGQQAVDICLIACMLFANFETLRGHHSSSMSHINSGVKILSEIHSNDTSGPSHGSLTVSSRPFVELANLEVLFNRLDSQAVAMMGNRPMTLGRICKENAIGFCQQIPLCFTSLEEARNSFDFHWNGCIQLFNNIDDDRGPGGNPARISFHEKERQKYLLVFKRWETSFQCFLHERGHTLTTMNWQGARVLQIMRIFVYTSVEANPYVGVGQETIWDQYLANYEHAISLAEEVIKTLLQEGRSNTNSFSPDMSIVAPLYAIAHKCRDPVLRRKAVSLLYAVPRQEGIWDSHLAARVAEKLISIEEQGLGPVNCCEDVPDAARLNTVDVQFDHGSRFGTIKYSRDASPTSTRREDYYETIKW